MKSGLKRPRRRLNEHPLNDANVVASVKRGGGAGPIQLDLALREGLPSHSHRRQLHSCLKDNPGPRCWDPALSVEALAI